MDFGGNCLSFDLRDAGNVSVYLCNEGKRARLHIILSGRVWCHSCVCDRHLLAQGGGLGEHDRCFRYPPAFRFLGNRASVL